jgi:hypothetical protein
VTHRFFGNLAPSVTARFGDPLRCDLIADVTHLADLRTVPKVLLPASFGSHHVPSLPTAKYMPVYLNLTLVADEVIAGRDEQGMGTASRSSPDASRISIRLISRPQRERLWFNYVQTSRKRPHDLD